MELKMCMDLKTKAVYQKIMFMGNCFKWGPQVLQGHLVTDHIYGDIYCEVWSNEILLLSVLSANPEQLIFYTVEFPWLWQTMKGAFWCRFPSQNPIHLFIYRYVSF